MRHGAVRLRRWCAYTLVTSRNVSSLTMPGRRGRARRAASSRLYHLRGSAGAALPDGVWLRRNGVRMADAHPHEAERVSSDVVCTRSAADGHALG